MENQITELQCERNIDTVVSEIKTICEQTRQYVLLSAVEIGRRLVEAKEMLPHGSWGEWITENFEFSHRQANLFMELFEGYGSNQTSLFGAELKSQTFANLSYTKALKLLALPEEEREDFVKENDVGGMSTRELERVIRERDEALKKAENVDKLQQEIDKANADVEALKKDKEDAKAELDSLAEKLEKVKQAEKKTKEKLKALQENPEIPQDVMDKIKADAEKKAAEEEKQRVEEQLNDANKRIAEAEKIKAEAEIKLKFAEDRAENLQKQLKMSAPEVTEFKALFEQTQQDMQKMITALEKIEDKEIAKKFRYAVEAMCKQYINNEE